MGQHFQIGTISKLASKVLPDDVCFMATLKRLPYRSYCYCCVSLPFGSVGIVLHSQQNMCRGFDSHRDHILVFRSVRAGDIMNGYDSVPLSNTVVRGKGIAPEIPVTQAVIIN